MSPIWLGTCVTKLPQENLVTVIITLSLNILVQIVGIDVMTKHSVNYDVLLNAAPINILVRETKLCREIIVAYNKILCPGIQLMRIKKHSKKFYFKWRSIYVSISAVEGFHRWRWPHEADDGIPRKIHVTPDGKKYWSLMCECARPIDDPITEEEVSNEQINTAEAAVRSQERVIEMDQDKENVQGSEVAERDGDLRAEICSMLDTDVLQVRDVVGEFQKLQEKQAKDMRRNDEEMSDEDMEATELSRKAPKEYESASAENGKLQVTTQLSERYHEPVVIGAAYAPHLRPHLEQWETVAEQTATVGKKSTAWVSMLNERVRALIDTGSMLSIVPIGLLARAQDNGFDDDSLTVIDRETLEPVYDASNKEMEFLGGVSKAVKMEGGSEYEVAFYISKEKGHEVLLGTNALGSLGVQIHLPKVPLFPIQR
ncbi:unnamed protein product [Haemonchus placei]|uniref:Peptidase A2 domain-containing protein n=1 Tax=Haemonchus placei TaxID=6290 RepID=A0A158QLZ0_HAEPC|nr:unnamed protein product [Haemonchus placei]